MIISSSSEKGLAKCLLLCLVFLEILSPAQLPAEQSLALTLQGQTDRTDRRMCFQQDLEQCLMLLVPASSSPQRALGDTELTLSERVLHSFIHFSSHLACNVLLKTSQFVTRLKYLSWENSFVQEKEQVLVLNSSTKETQGGRFK